MISTRRKMFNVAWHTAQHYLMAAFFEINFCPCASLNIFMKALALFTALKRCEL